MPAGEVRIAPDRVPSVFVLPDVVPGTVADSEVDARYTAPPPRELKCPSGEFLEDSVMLEGVFVFGWIVVLCLGFPVV